MRHALFRLCLILPLLALPAFAATPCDKPLRIAVSALGPSIVIHPGQNPSGETPEMLSELARLSGCSLLYVDLPRPRARQALKAGEIDIIPTAAPSPAIEADADYVPLGWVRDIVALRAPQAERLRSADDLLKQRMRIGVLRGRNYGPTYSNLLAQPAMASLTEQVTDPAQLTQLLRVGRVDAIIVAAPLLLADLAPDVHAGHIVTIDLAPQDPAVPWGFYMSRLTLSPAVRDTLRDATGRMLASGTYRQIAERHYPGLERLGIRLNEGKTVR